MTELTPDLIVDLLFPQDLQISPDGTRVVYMLAPLSKKEEHETSALWLAEIDRSHPPRQFTSGDFHDHAPQWSPDGSQIAFLSDRKKRGTDQLYVIAADGGEARLLMPEEQKKPVNRFVWSPLGGQIAFTSADEPTEEDEKREKERDVAKVYGEKWPYARLRLLSLATGEITTLMSGDRHIADFAWHPRGTELAYAVQQTPDLESRAREMVIQRIAVAGGEPQVVCRFASAVNALTWSHDGEMLLCIAPVEAGAAQSSQAVYAVPAARGEPRRLAGGETNCIIDLLPLQQDRQVAVGVVEGLEARLCRLETTTGEVTTLYPTTTEDRAAEYAAWHMSTLEDGRLALAVVRGAGTQPWEIWAGLPGNEPPALHQLSTHQEQRLAGLTFAPSEPFYWTAPDGLALDGILAHPLDGPKERPLQKDDALSLP